MPTTRRLIWAVLLCCASATPAYAQLRGKFAVGVSVTTLKPEASELSTKVRIVPTVSRVPSKGWGIALGLNWFEADVDGGFVNLDDRLAKVNVRPLMAGVGYTAVRGRLSVTPSLIAGPSLNTLKIDDEWTDQFAVGGDDFDTKANVYSVAVRPGMSVTYAVAPRLGLTAFGGYLFNRPEFKVLTPTGETRTRWKTDGVALSAGVVVPIYK